jgi:hypothetical protein
VKSFIICALQQAFGGCDGQGMQCAWGIKMHTELWLGSVKEVTTQKTVIDRSVLEKWGRSMWVGFICAWHRDQWQALVNMIMNPERLSVSQEGLCYMESVNKLINVSLLMNG